MCIGLRIVYHLRSDGLTVADRGGRHDHPIRRQPIRGTQKRHGDTPRLVDAVPAPGASPSLLSHALGLCSLSLSLPSVLASPYI